MWGVAFLFLNARMRSLAFLGLARDSAEIRMLVWEVAKVTFLFFSSSLTDGRNGVDFLPYDAIVMVLLRDQ